MEIKDNALELLDKVKILSQSNREVLFEVDVKLVRLFKKPGRTLMSCTCENHARFVLEQPLCKHKLACLVYWFNNERKEKAQQVKISKEGMKSVNAVMGKREQLLDDLERVSLSNETIFKSLENPQDVKLVTKLFKEYIILTNGLFEEFQNLIKTMFTDLDKMIKTGEVTI